MDRKLHWENVYETKTPNEVSWTEIKPQTSLDFIHSLPIRKDAKIIDVGGGESKLVDCLLEMGYTNITVLDISEKALQKTQQRLGEKARFVKWIVNDITEFETNEVYDLWHDRATFHFLTNKGEVLKYLTIINRSVSGYLLLGTFSVNGPLKCSGLAVQQYDAESLSHILNPHFKKIKCTTINHTTPFNTQQNFLFCSFKKNTI